MAALEKLSKTLEALKATLSSHTSTDETIQRSKEKISLCVMVTDMICTPEAKIAPNFTSLLSYSMETLFLMCDDKDSNIRMIADECLNRIIKSLMDGHIGKVNLELHQEIKRNRNARCLRAALWRFGELAHAIRPNKRKVYIQNMVPYIKIVAKRKEESLLETLATSLPKILLPLGCFMTDNEIKDLLQVFMQNIHSENAVFRRTSASSMLAICLNCNKPQFFIIHTINSLLESVIPVKEDQNPYTVVGVLNCLRSLVVHVEAESREMGFRGSFGLKRRQRVEAAPSNDSILQVFELCLHWTGHPDHNVVTAALETLNELLLSPPPHLVSVLLSQAGLSRSRIHSGPSWKLSSRTLSEMSVATTVPSSLADEMSFLDLEDPPPKTNLGGWLEEEGATPSSLPARTDGVSLLASSLCPLSLESIQDYPDSESVMSEDFGSVSKISLPQSPEPEMEARDSPSPPPDSLHIMCWDIGDLMSQPPLLYTARRLVTAFLVPECGSVRVSVRSLALICLSQVLRLKSCTFLSQLDRNGLSTPQGTCHVWDVLSLSTHSDQQLRGLTRPLVAPVIHSHLTSGLPLSSSSFTLEALVHILIQGIEDESSVCIRHSLTALSFCLTQLIESSEHHLALPVLNQLIHLSNNPYWLVKVKLVELLCSLPYQCVYFISKSITYQEKVLRVITEDFLANEDSRVRKTTSENIVKFIKNLYFPIDYGVDNVNIARGMSVAWNIFSDLFENEKGSHKLDSQAIIENNLSRVIDILIETLLISSSKHLSFGCIEALCLLSEEYRPSVYPVSWQCALAKVDNSSNDRLSASNGLFSVVVALLTKSPVALDMECHQWLLTLAANLFSGLLTSHLRKNNDETTPDLKLISVTEELLVHEIRLLYIFGRVVEDGLHTRNLLASPLKKRPSVRPISPSKGSTIPEKEVEKEEKVRFIGQYTNNPHCNKLYEIIRAGYTNYKLTLDSGPSEKFLALIQHTLSCLEVLLSPNSIVETETFFEEVLQYLRVSFVLDSEGTVKVVYQLLRSLFESSLLGIKNQPEKPKEEYRKPMEKGYYRNLIRGPLERLQRSLQPLELSKQEAKLTKENASDSSKAPLTQCDRATLASRIKLFETIVIQSLKEYTISCNVKLQAQVLRLLTLLVQLKVNYCLLDSDQVFIQFVLKQFEFLEAGQIHDAEHLIPSIFQFLVYLCNEKNHSKPVISMPKIIQLCDGLMASGQNPLTHSVPALIPVVEHVFFKNTTSTDTKESETQKEVLLAMLLRLAEYPQVVEMLYNLMEVGPRWDLRWDKWYLHTLDTIFPLLSDGRLQLNNITTLHSLLRLSPSVKAPLSNLLVFLFSHQQEGESVTHWLNVNTVMLWSVCMYEEKEVLSLLKSLNLYVREEGDDPLKVNTVSKTLPPQSLLAKLLLRIIMRSVLKLKKLVTSQYKDENVSDLEKILSNFLLCCVHMLQPGSYSKVTNSLSNLIRNNADLEEVNISFFITSSHCQMSTLVWLQVLMLLDQPSQEFWGSLMATTRPHDGRGSLNEEVLSQGTIILFCEYLSKKPNDLSSLKWLLENHIQKIVCNCHDPPIEKLLGSVYNLEANSKILLEACSTCILRKEPVFTHRLLHTLEYIHSDFSGSVLKFVASSLIEHKNIAIARLAAAFCSRTIEYMLTLDNEAVRKQMNEEELSFIFKSLSSNQRQFKRHGGLINLINKFGKQCFGLSLCELDSLKPVEAELIQTIKLDKIWFCAQVKSKCCRGSDIGTRKCAYLLSKLEALDLEQIMSSEDFDLNILQHCFSSTMQISNQDASEKVLTDKTALYICSKNLLLKLINNLCISILDEEKAMNSENLSDIVDVPKFLNESFPVVSALINFMESLNSISIENETVQNYLPKEYWESLCRFGVLCVEVIHWILNELKERDINNWPSTVQSLLDCSACVLQKDFLSSYLTYDQISIICDSLLNMFAHITSEQIKMKKSHFSYEVGDSQNDGEPAFETALKMVSLISFIEKNTQRLDVPDDILRSSRWVVASLGRHARINWLCRVPLEAWQPPLQSLTPPPIPIHLLHDTELLYQIVYRIRFLGWTGKFQFEESWVCLLSALSPNPELDTADQEEVSAVMQATSLAIDGITWLVLSTLAQNSRAGSQMKYLHIPRHSNSKFSNLRCWKRLVEMNEILCLKMETFYGSKYVRLSRIDKSANLERGNDCTRYGFEQLSLSYLQSLIKSSEEGNVDEEQTNLQEEQKRLLSANGIDIRSCIQFILDLFSQWVLPNSGISLPLQLSMVKSILCISDLFNERSHFEWMLSIFLDFSKNHSLHDELMHQYLTIGIAKACAVLDYFEGEVSDRVFKVVDGSLRSSYLPVRDAGLHGLLYLLQRVHTIEKLDGSVEIPKLKPQEFGQKILQASNDYIQKNFLDESPFNSHDSLLQISLIFFLLEYYPNDVPNKQEIVKKLINIAKNCGNSPAYRTILQGFERLVLDGELGLNEQITRLSLDRFSQSDPNITIPALQLLLACIYSEQSNQEEPQEESQPWTIEIMEKLTALFDRIKKGYPIEVEIVCDILPGIMSDFFSASDILTRVIGEFLSPNQPHKKNMAAMVFQVFSQACSEQQLPLLQDWVVYSVNNFTHNLPLMTAVWSLCCFFISASVNPWLKAIFPCVQSRIRHCDYEDRHILCLAAADFYSQLNSSQQETFLRSIKNTSSSQKSPFADIIATL